MEKVNKDDLFTSIKSSLVLPDRTSRKITGKLTYMVFYLFFSVIVLTIFSFYAEYTFLRNAFSMITKEPAIAFNVYRSAIVILAVIFVLVLEPHILNRVLYALMPVTVLALIGNFLSFKYLNGNQFLNILTLCIIIIGIGAFLASNITIFLNFISSYERIIILSVVFFTSIFLLPLLKKFIEINNFFGSFAVPLLSLLIISFAMFFVSKEHFRNVKMNDEEIPKSLIIIMITMFIMFVLCELSFIILKSNILVPKYDFSYEIYYLTMFVTSIIGVVMFWCFKYSNIYYIIIWIMSIVVLNIAGLVLIIYNGTFPIKLLFEILSGFATANGFIMSFMLMGKVLEDKASLKVYRTVILIMGLVFAAFEICFAFISYKNAELVFIITELIALALLIFVIVMLFRVIRSINIDKTVVNMEPKCAEEPITSEYVNPYKVLTNKEIIVFEQLLLGNTLRQIAGELKMKYDTVNFHYKNIYRKLNVNSRIELIVRYGKK